MSASSARKRRLRAQSVSRGAADRLGVPRRYLLTPAQNFRGREVKTVYHARRRIARAVRDLRHQRGFGV